MDRDVERYSLCIYYMYTNNARHKYMIYIDIPPSLFVHSIHI